MLIPIGTVYLRAFVKEKRNRIGKGSKIKVKKSTDFGKKDINKLKIK
jgi:hypothetical protein